MKVLHVSGPSAGGIGHHINQLQLGLTEFGIDSSVLAPVRTRPGAVARTARELKRGNYDLVHCHGYQGGAVGRAAGVFAGVPAVVTIHNTLQVVGRANQLARLAEGWMHKHTACWVTVSSYLRNYALGVLGIPENRMVVIANGIEVPAEIPPWFQEPVVGIVARLVPSKGVDIFLKAVQSLRPEVPNLRAVVIGDGPAKYQLKAMAHHLGLDNIVRFRGHISDVSAHLERMAVFVLPTRSEGLGISIIEAMSQGVPVVATAVGGVPELVCHETTGLLTQRDDYLGIARAVRQMLDNREQTEKMRRGAFLHISENYSSRAMLESTQEIYRRVLNG